MRPWIAIALAAATLTLAACGADDEDGASSRSPGAGTAEIPHGKEILPGANPRGADRQKAETVIRRYLAAAANADREATCAAATPGYARSERACVQESLSRKELAACADAPTVQGIRNPSGRIPPVIGKGRPAAPYLALAIDGGVRSVVCWTSGEDFIWIIVAPDARIDMVSSGLDSSADASG